MAYCKSEVVNACGPILYIKEILEM